MNTASKSITLTLHGRYDTSKSATLRPRATPKEGTYYISARAMAAATRRARLVTGDFLTFDGLDWNAAENGWFIHQ